MERRQDQNTSDFLNIKTRWQNAVSRFGRTPKEDNGNERVEYECAARASIGVYSGLGASHSWLWFVDLFDRYFFRNVHFLNEKDISAGALRDLEVLCLSGGDTFGIAKALGEAGSRALLEFLKSGGIYIGACAGAYLPLKSSKAPLDLFNFVDAKIGNLTKTLPRPLAMGHKFCTPYGCQFVFHPVRDGVELSISGDPPFSGNRRVVAPLFGGPPLICSNGCEVLATYHGFTKKTFFLVDPELASKTLLGKAAVIRKEVEKGVLYLFGPHFEHPNYPEANNLLLESIEWELGKRGPHREGFSPQSVRNRVETDVILPSLKRYLSNARIVAAGLEMLPIQWKIGHKVYEPGKIREFIESVWKRLKEIRKTEKIFPTRLERHCLEAQPPRIWDLLKQVKRGIDLGKDTTELAGSLFTMLNQFSSAFFNMYFRTKTMTDR